jgi:hypothetical protein
MVDNIQNIEINFLARYINKIEKTYANYLFNKYVVPTLNLDNITKLEEQNKYKNEKFNEFKKKIFYTKPGVITQNILIKNELNDIKRANQIYQKEPNLYLPKIRKTVFGYPDRYRCEFIIYFKNKFHRCKNKVFKDKEIEVDDDMTLEEKLDEQHLYVCKRHIGLENKYAQEYQNIIKILSELHKL